MELGTALAEAQLWREAKAVWEQAQSVISSIQDISQRTDALKKLGVALAQAQLWGEAKTVISLIQGRWQRTEAWMELRAALAAAGEHEQLLQLLQQLWLQAETRDDAIQLLPLIGHLAPLQPNLAGSCCEAFSWVDDFLRG